MEKSQISGRDDFLELKQTWVSPPVEVWRCEKGHERRYDPLVVKPGESTGFSLFQGGQEYGPYCFDCMIAFLEKYIPKMTKVEGER